MSMSYKLQAAAAAMSAIFADLSRDLSLQHVANARPQYAPYLLLVRGGYSANDFDAAVEDELDKRS